MDFKNTEIMVCLGTGGVGKTTVAATLGYLAAKQGLRTLVMTIDPSQRLAQTLGIEGKTEITRVPLEEKLDLYAAVVDHKKVFDDFLRRAMRDQEAAERIFNNRLYKELSTSLSGSQEFTCLEMLYDVATSGDYDLVILDTPPAHHAIDFLRAPEKLAELFQKETIQWFTQGTKGSSLIQIVFQKGTQKVLSILEGITGSEFIGSLNEFFRSLGPWSTEILKRTHQFHELLVKRTTHFYLVTAPDAISLKAADKLAQDVFQGGYHLEKIIFNRARAPWSDDIPIPEGKSGLHQELNEQYNMFTTYFEHRQRDVKAFLKKLPKKTTGVLLPEFEKDIANLDTLQEFSKVFVNEAHE